VRPIQIAVPNKPGVRRAPPVGEDDTAWRSGVFAMLSVLLATSVLCGSSLNTSEPVDATTQDGALT
jgi:hypothetical protein